MLAITIILITSLPQHHQQVEDKQHAGHHHHLDHQSPSAPPAGRRQTACWSSLISSPSLWSPVFLSTTSRRQTACWRSWLTLSVILNRRPVSRWGGVLHPLLFHPSNTRCNLRLQPGGTDAEVPEAVLPWPALCDGPVHHSHPGSDAGICGVQLPLPATGAAHRLPLWADAECPQPQRPHELRGGCEFWDKENSKLDQCVKGNRKSK